MNKISKSLFAVFLGLVATASINAADADADKQAIVAACTDEAKGAIDVNEYIEECVKEKQEEMKEAAAASDK